MPLKLRHSAEEKLATGTAPFTHGWPAGTQALTLLHGLASAPVTASVALKLLHELQVHQVELDLQHEQAEQDCQQLAEGLGNYTTLFDLAPFAYVTLDHDGLLLAVNRNSAEWFAPRAGEGTGLAGRRIADLLAPECHSVVADLLAALCKGGGRQTCAVQSRASGANGQAVATATPDGAQVLMAFMTTGPVIGH